MDIIIPTSGGFEPWLANIASKYSVKAIDRLSEKEPVQARRLLGAVQFLFDGDTVITNEDGSLKHTVEENLRALANVIPIGFLMASNCNLLPFQAVAAVAGGYVVRNDFSVGCVDEVEFDRRVVAQVASCMVLAAKLGIDRKVTEMHVKSLTEYFSVNSTV